MAAETLSRRQTLIAGLILSGMFLIGVAAGAGLTICLRPPGPPPFGEGEKNGLPPPFGKFGLDDDQKRRAIPIVERHRVAMEAAIREAFPKIRAVREQFDREMRTIMTPEQNRRFDEFLESDPPMPGFQAPGRHHGGPPPSH